MIFIALLYVQTCGGLVATVIVRLKLLPKNNKSTCMYQNNIKLKLMKLDQFTQSTGGNGILFIY